MAFILLRARIIQTHIIDTETASLYNKNYLPVTIKVSDSYVCQKETKE
ncbi:hypothetical protein HMPREF1548_03828 [Clostridium sp. KLE 1755]|nr:hypothetical protein HMPREF1548_03828 [Clostridium sp. KLE 1755]